MHARMSEVPCYITFGIETLARLLIEAEKEF